MPSNWMKSCIDRNIDNEPDWKDTWSHWKAGSGNCSIPTIVMNGYSGCCRMTYVLLVPVSVRLLSAWDKNPGGLKNVEVGIVTLNFQHFWLCAKHGYRKILLRFNLHLLQPCWRICPSTPSMTFWHAFKFSTPFSWLTKYSCQVNSYILLAFIDLKLMRVYVSQAFSQCVSKSLVWGTGFVEEAAAF